MPATVQSSDLLCDVDAAGKKVNYCEEALGANGCPTEDLDERGYCHHLVGFTNDGKVVEVVGPWLRNDKDGKAFDTGQKCIQGRQAIKEGDVLLNPESPQTINGITTMAKRWVSARVYRGSVKATKTAPRPEEFDDGGEQAGEQNSSILLELRDLAIANARQLEALASRVDDLEEKPAKRKPQRKAKQPELVEA